MKQITKNDFDLIENYMMNKTRDLELAMFNYLFLAGDRIDASFALSMYQNRDGGFGHALEPDNTTATSSPMETAFAFKYLISVGFDKTNMDEITKQMVTKAIKYCQEKAIRKNGLLLPVNPDIMNYPHASKWDYKEELDSKNCHFPSTFIDGAILNFTRNRTLYYQQSLDRIKKSIDEYLLILDPKKEEIEAFIWAYQMLEKERIVYKNKDLLSKIRHDIKGIIVSDPSLYGTRNIVYPFDLLIDQALLDKELEQSLQSSFDYLIDSRTHLGVWDYLNDWFSPYEEDYEMARIKWSGIITIDRLRLLKKYNRFEG